MHVGDGTGFGPVERLDEHATVAEEVAVVRRWYKCSRASVQ